MYHHRSRLFYMIQSEQVVTIPVVSYSSPPQRTPIQAGGVGTNHWFEMGRVDRSGVVLVIGAALGIKFGYDQGWFSFVTPAVRLMMLAGVGFSLIAAGEWVFRKVNKLSAVGSVRRGCGDAFCDQLRRLCLLRNIWPKMRPLPAWLCPP